MGKIIPSLNCLAFFRRLMLALLPIYLSTKIFLDAYQIFFWKRYTKTWALFRAIATFTRPLFWSIAFRNLISCLLSFKDYCFSTWNLMDSLVLVLQFLFFLLFSSASLVIFARRLVNFSLFTAPRPIARNLLLAFITRLTTSKIFWVIKYKIDKKTPEKTHAV